MELSDKIRILRKARGFSQEGLGENLSRVSSSGISRQSISDWENGKTEPKLDNIRDLAKVLNVSFDALLDESVDLNDAETLASVLRNVDPETKKTVNSKFRYSIQWTYITFRDYISYIILFIVVAVFIVCATQIKNVSDDFGWFLTACICFALLPSLLITNITKAIRMIKGTFHNYPYAEINNTHMIISARGNSADNTIYIPIEKILKIELGKKQKRTYGDINVFVEGKNKPINMYSVTRPQELIKLFESLKSFIEDPNEIKIL